jgi:crotonobetainyl-CoA:carnitine CoA-transferase CaiB-like acyl-CoA transferase
MMQVLKGLRVLDFTTAWAGPMATRIFSYFGADVIKIEAPNRLDSWRGPRRGNYPFRYPDQEMGPRPFNRNCYFNTQNHDKRSVGVNLKVPGARDLVLRLAATCDVAVANFSPGVLNKLGLGYTDLTTVRPDLIMVEMPAYGNTGPIAHHVGMGNNMEAMTGMPLLIGYGDGIPTLTGTAYLDPLGGLNAAAAVLTALVHRRRTGQGQYIEVAQREAAMHWAGEYLLQHAETGTYTPPAGNRVPEAAPHDAYPCKGDDDWIAIAVFTDEQWQALCAVLGRPDLAVDPRFARAADRWANQDLLREPVSSWTRERSKQDAAELLQRCGVPAAAVAHGRDVALNPHLWVRGFYSDLEHPEAGRHPYQGLACRLSGTPGAMRTASPCFGQHNREILQELLGMSEAQIMALEQAGVLATEPQDAE